MPISVRLAVIALALSSLISGCGIGQLFSYLLWPTYPVFDDGLTVVMNGLREETLASKRSDGLWRIAATNEIDGLRVLGYLQARDRMGQLDLFRHLARGEIAELVGDRPFAGKSSLDVDRLNRFLGFRAQAGDLLRLVSAEERRSMRAFSDGINAWIAAGPLPLEHRLLGIDTIRPWKAEDSLAIYLMVMHGLGGNADREIRRLAIACAAGIEALERIWPTDLEHSVYALPREHLRDEIFPVAPGIVAEMSRALPTLCRRKSPAARGARPVADGAVLQNLRHGWSASNNWVVSGSRTRSGKPLLSSDPHLPHMNPPMIWGFELATPEYRVAGFTLPGLHRVVFGHNGSLAWGATTNHVDRQDLVVHKPLLENGVEGYEIDGRFEPFQRRSETFHVRGGEPIEATARFTRDGPLLNDLNTELTDLLPLVALRTTPIGRGRDLDGAASLARARTVRDFATAIDNLDLGCSSWVAADTSGSIAYRSPCLLPVRDGWRGTFPIPGWSSRYDWKSFVAKDELPASFDPARAWLATANNQIVPANKFPTTYNNDVSAPARYTRISQLLEKHADRLDADTSASFQMDLRDLTWVTIRATAMRSVCARSDGPPMAIQARRILCEWDGTMDAQSVAPTLYTLVTHALADAALADELPGGAGGELWSYVQSFPQFEVNARWLWTRKASDAVWDDVRTEEHERRELIIDRALRRAVEVARDRYGNDTSDWQWGKVRPFVLEHLFATGGGVLGRLLNADPLAIGGGNETLFKNQFSRGHRKDMKVEIGPIVRFTIDMSEPWAARYTMAGGQSGWPGAPHYADLLADWAAGRSRPLTPPPSAGDVNVTFAPGD